MKRPRVRVAKFGDVPQILDMIKEGHARSRYSGSTCVDERRAKALIMQSIQRHGGVVEGSTFVAVADTGERLEGFIIGVLQPMYLVLDAIEATDVFWYARPDAHGMTASRLLRAMHKWVPAGALIRHGNSDAISDADLSGRLLEQHGLRKSGGTYEKEKTK